MALDNDKEPTLAGDEAKPDGVAEPIRPATETADSDPKPSETRPTDSRVELNVPEPLARPGEIPDFSYLEIPSISDTKKPEIDVAAEDTRTLAAGLIRVSDLKGRSRGEWQPQIGPEDKIRALKAMISTKLLEEQFLLLQRQGKAAFAMRSRGEEAVAVATAMAVDATSPGYGPGLDMHFPTYRQAGLLVANGHSLEEMICQVLSNTGDRLKGAQLPVLFSVPECGFFSVSGNLGTQIIQAVGWAMAAAIQNNPSVGVAWTGEGATAENDFHSALVFASVYQPPAIINVVNNQWAISSFQGIAGGMQATFAERGIGYGIATLRVDGNDFLAAYAVAQWATERARSGNGPTLIEWVTYRAGSHSSSDDPSKYRPLDAAESWPLGDPIERFKLHMQISEILGDAEIVELTEQAETEVNEAVAAAEPQGTLNSGPQVSPEEMFNHVFAEMPAHLQEQKAEAGF